MSQNMLVDRLKAAKRELTALKTAHKRGLGNLRVYTQKYEIPYAGHESGLWNLIITVEFDNSFTAYPFVYLLPTRLGGSGFFAALLVQATIEYIDGGYGARMGTVYYHSATDNSFTVVSTAPVISVSYEWSR